MPSKRPAKPLKKKITLTRATRARASQTRSTLAPELTRKLAQAAEAAGSERLTAVEHAADRLGGYLREHRNTLKVVAPLLLVWAPADLYDRIEAALRTKAGLAVRPTGAIVAGLGAAGDHGAKV